MSDVRNVIVIGSGPAGYTAALYAAQSQPRAPRPEGSRGRRAVDAHDRRRELPGLRRRASSAPSSWIRWRSRPRASAPRSSRCTSPRSTFGSSVRRPGRRPDVAAPRRSSWRPAPARGGSTSPARSSSEAGASARAPRATASSSATASCRGRRRRLRDGGGHVPHQVRDQGHDRPPARRVPRIEGHAGRARWPTRRSR